MRWSLPPSSTSSPLLLPPAKLKSALKAIGFCDVVEVAIGADLCTVDEAHDFLEEVSREAGLYGYLLLPGMEHDGKDRLPPAWPRTSP